MKHLRRLWDPPCDVYYIIEEYFYTLKWEMGINMEFYDPRSLGMAGYLAGKWNEALVHDYLYYTTPLTTVETYELMFFC